MHTRQLPLKCKWRGLGPEVREQLCACCGLVWALVNQKQNVVRCQATQPDLGFRGNTGWVQPPTASGLHLGTAPKGLHTPILGHVFQPAPPGPPSPWCGPVWGCRRAFGPDQGVDTTLGPGEGGSTGEKVPHESQFGWSHLRSGPLLVLDAVRLSPGSESGPQRRKTQRNGR